MAQEFGLYNEENPNHGYTGHYSNLFFVDGKVYHADNSN